MTARQVQTLAGTASTMTAVFIGVAGCAAAGHTTANDVPRPAGQTAAAAGQASPQTADRAATALRRSSTLMECADPVAPGGAADGGTSPIPLATPSQAAVRQVRVVNLSQPGLVIVCGPVIVHCPPGFRILYRKTLSSRRPRLLLPYAAVCITRFRMGTLPPEPRLTPLPARTMPLHTLPPHTMPPQAAGQ